jgi:hypothetical protein
MKRVLVILMMVLFTIPMMAQPKITKEKNKKNGYYEYKIEMEMGGNIKTSSIISTLNLRFYYQKNFSGYNDKGQMFFEQTGYDNCVEILDNGKKTIDLTLVIDNEDTLRFKPTYLAVNFWSVNGVISERPDRYMNYAFYDIYDADIEKIINAGAIEILKFGGYENENAGWYFTSQNIDDLKYFMNYVRTVVEKK